MSSSPSRLSQLTGTIQSQTRAIEVYLRSNELAEPSLRAGAPFVLPLSPELQSAQSQVIEAAIELLGVISGPVPYISSLISPSTHTLTSIHAVHKFRIAHKLQPAEQIPHAELAKRCDMDESDLSRILRQCIAWQVFTEPRKGFVGHNAVSLAIVQTPYLDDYIGASFGVLNPAAAKGPEQLQKWPGSQDPTHNGYALATGIDGVFFDTLQSRTTDARNYTNMMKFLGASPMMAVSNVMRDLKWTESDMPRVIVDMGGGHGALCTEILRGYPSIKHGIVQELEEVVHGAEVPADLKLRMEFQTHNILDPQTRHADVYIMRWILHDWPEPQCILILRNLLPMMKKGSRLILNEMVVPEPGQVTVSEERMYRGFDMVMKTASNAKERDEDGWRTLLHAVDPNLYIASIRRTPPALQSIMELRYRDG